MKNIPAMAFRRFYVSNYFPFVIDRKIFPKKYAAHVLCHRDYLHNISQNADVSKLDITKAESAIRIKNSRCFLGTSTHILGRNIIRDASEIADEDIANIDKANTHLLNQIRHQKLGPIYTESIGSGVNVVWIADPNYCATIFREGTCHQWSKYNAI